MGSGGKALGIIGIILAAGAIGFAFVVWNGQNTTNSDLDDLTDEFNNLTEVFNNLTDEFNNLTEVFNNLTDEYNNLESDFSNLTRTIVVGIWDALDDNLDYAPYTVQNNWLFEFGDNKLNNTDYISVSNTNTRIALLKSGWYQIHISALLGGISPSSNYWVRLLKDGAIESYLDFYSTSSNDSSWHYIDLSAFVYSNGTNYIEINGYSSSDDFLPSTNDIYNQLTIKHVAI